MTVPFTPERWAFEITHLLNAVLGADRYPLDIAMIARDYSSQRFPRDPILKVAGGDIPKFDGALYPSRKRPGWHILYNDTITSRGRINFTLAHEFGHYLLHRGKYPTGFECGQQQIVRWDSEYGQVEHQANVFAANFLMPLDDFRRLLPDRSPATLAVLKQCAERYNVSLIAAALRWLSYTTKRAILVNSRDRYILWARSSESALRTGAYFKTAGRSPIEVPATSLAANPGRLAGGQAEMDHAAGVWLRQPVCEMALHAEQYDFVLSLLILDDAPPRFVPEDPDELEDTYDRFVR
ncbi:MAG: ImmA/IrrE family metallo-endopeptidase [Mesorhizobium sp.]|nr:MAG: ImmA/IrrE family metallo-endopeptidase [Mesorhizobium sp.]